MQIPHSIILDTRRKKDNGLYPIKIRIYANGKQDYFPTGIDATTEDFTESRRNNLRSNHSLYELHIGLKSIEKKVSEVLSSIEEQYSPDNFKSAYFGITKNKTSIIEFIEKMRKDLVAQGRIGTSLAYKGLKSSLSLIQPNLRFSDVTKDFLDRMKVSKSKFRLVHLRAVFNCAIKEGLINSTPFSKFEMPKKAATKAKRALTKEHINQLFNYKPKNESEQKALDYFLFSYLSNGMNFADICNLKYEQIVQHGEVVLITFQREKTKNKKSMLTKCAFRDKNWTIIKSIIDRQGNQTKLPLNKRSGYVFPIFNGKITPQEQFTKKIVFIGVIDGVLKRIGQSIGVSNLTTYFARHTFATQLQTSGVPISAISGALGHHSTAQTEIYLSGFNDEEIANYNEHLTSGI